MKICLAMIGRNEAHCLQRMLDTALPFVDCFAFVDTGSTDGTQELVMDQKIRHTILDAPWTDFATARTRALRFAESSHNLSPSDWILMVDCDDMLVWPGERGDEGGVRGQFRAILEKSICSGFRVQVRHAEITYLRQILFRADGTWRYRCPLHEFPARCGLELTANQTLPFPVYQMIGGGDRSQNPDKYARDADMLVIELDRLRQEGKSGPDFDLIPRVLFYLAQSYRDAGNHVMAWRTYLLRSMESGGYQQERYVSALELSKLTEHVRGGHLMARESSEYWLRRAFYLDPTRIEAPFWLAKSLAGAHDRAEGDGDDLEQAFLWANLAAGMVPQEGALFGQHECYEWAKNLRQLLLQRMLLNNDKTG